jgi:hypothetical protein
VSRLHWPYSAIITTIQLPKSTQSHTKKATKKAFPFLFFFPRFINWVI